VRVLPSSVEPWNFSMEAEADSFVVKRTVPQPYTAQHGAAQPDGQVSMGQCMHRDMGLGESTCTSGMLQDKTTRQSQQNDRCKTLKLLPLAKPSTRLILNH
jgi:hypothetical protein